MLTRLGGALALAVALGGGLHALPGRPAAGDPPGTALRFAISFPAARSAQALDGRIILVIANNDRSEPRFQNDVYDPKTQLAFGLDVEGLKPGQEAIIDGRTPGYPLESLARVPPGDYWV